jgi:hypothetical protein
LKNRGKQSCGTTLCGRKDNTQGCKGREHHWGWNTTIYRSVSGSIIIHKGASDGINIVEGDGNWDSWVRSCSRKKTCNLGQSCTFGEKVLKF